MAYTQFKDLDVIQEKLGTKHQINKIFGEIVCIQPSDYLKAAIEMANELSVRTEKARSELMVAPILMEVRKRNPAFTFFSGENLNADVALGLNGECDFVMSKNEKSALINAPIIQIVEAKRHDFELGTAQCSAQMIGARIFNEKHDKSITKIYGCVTTGTEWLFLKLDNNLITIDNRKYYLHNLPELLGVFQVIIDEYKDILD